MGQEGLALARELDDRPTTAFALASLGVTVVSSGDLDRGRELLAEALPLFRALGDVRYIAITCTMLGEAARSVDDHVRAAQLFREGLLGHLAVGDRAFIEVGLGRVAELAAASRPVEAARLLGAAERLRETLGVRDYQSMTTIRTQLSEGDLEAALAAGRALTIEQAAEEALELAEQLGGTSTVVDKP